MASHATLTDEAPTRPRATFTRISIPELVIWGIVTTIAYLAVELELSGLSVLAGVAIAFGMRTLFRSGGELLTTVGLCGLASLLFVGVAVLVIPADNVPDAAMLARATYLAQLMVLGVVGIASAPKIVTASPEAHEPTTFSSLTLLTVGILGFALGMSMSSVAALHFYADALTWTSPLVATLGAASSAGRHRGLLMLVPAALFGWYIATWSGSGRLVIFSLALGMLMVYQYRRLPRSRISKAMLVALLVPSLFLASLIETNRHEPGASLLHVPEGFVATDSLYSVWSPLYVFSWLLGQASDGLLEPHGFHTFFAALTVWIPRAFWEGKPSGWGRELAFLLNPQAAEMSNHSEAALAPAEFLWGYGLLGIVFGTLICGLLVRLVDGKLEASRCLFVPEGRAAFGVLPWVITASAILSLWWGGSFDFLSRVFMQLLGLGFAVGTAWLIEPWLGSRISRGAIGRRRVTR